MSNLLNKEQALIAAVRGNVIQYRIGQRDWKEVTSTFMWENAGSQTTQFRIKPNIVEEFYYAARDIGDTTTICKAELDAANLSLVFVEGKLAGAGMVHQK